MNILNFFRKDPKSTRWDEDYPRPDIMRDVEQEEIYEFDENNLYQEMAVEEGTVARASREINERLKQLTRERDALKVKIDQMQEEMRQAEVTIRALQSADIVLARDDALSVKSIAA